MLMFFCALKRRGALDEHEVESMRTRIVESVLFRTHLTHCEVYRPSPAAVVVVVSNEPQGARVIGDQVIVPCGMFWALDSFAAIEPGPRFADDISRLSGRFSALMVKGNTFAIGTPATRVDSVFHAESDACVFFGNQASVLSVLRDGAVRYRPHNLISFISAGYFGSDETPYDGVTTLPPLTTIYHDGDSLHRATIDLADLKADGRSHTEILEACSDALSAAVLPLVDLPEPVQLGLTGGKDSRLLLAALTHAGARATCLTNSKGEANRSDVWVARALAALVGVEHTVVDISNTNVAAPGGQSIDLMARAASTLRNSDGMMGALTPLRGDPSVHRAQLSLWGHGGECLRGGWAENLHRPGEQDIASIFRRNFEGYPVFADAAQASQHDFAGRWIADQLARCRPADVLDIAYLYFRIGRWVGAGSRGSSSKVLPLLDNRVSREVLSMGAQKKRSHYLHRELIARLLPAARDLPLANKFWHGTSEEERARLRASYPDAYGQERPRRTPAKQGTPILRRMRGLFGRRPVAGLAPPVVTHIRDYLIREGRLDLLTDVLDPDRTARFLRSPDPALEPMRFLLGAYTAAVLLSEDWREARLPSRVISVDKSRPSSRENQTSA
jgi:hypothetical protein